MRVQAASALGQIGDNTGVSALIKALQEASEDVVGTLNDFQPYQYVGQLGYYTHWMEPNFGLLQLGVRFYDPEVGRFTQMDVLATDTVADMSYAALNPLSVTDPDGRKCRKFDNSPTIKRCWSILKKCIVKYPFYNRAKERLGDDIYMCDGDGSYLWIPPRYAESDCYQRGGKWRCKIWLYNDKFFNGDYDPCETFLHELIHIGSWPRSDKRAETEVENAASYLWFYLCDPKTKCQKKPPDWHRTVDPWVK